MSSEKSHVSMERKVCFVCGTEFDTNSLLLDKRLRNSMERYTVTGYGICPEHQKQLDDGYVMLIGVLNQAPEDQRLLKPSEAQRSGRIAALHRDVWGRVFTGAELPKNGIAFVEDAVLEHLEKLHNEALERRQ